MKLKSHLKRYRQQRGLTQHELARLAGLSRQALSSIETGAAGPSTAVALRLARSLACRVEDLFALADRDRELRAVLARPPSGRLEVPLDRVVVGSVAGRWVAHALDPRRRARDLTTAADAIVSGRPRGAQVRLRPLLETQRLSATVLLSGCDPALGLLAERAGLQTAGARAIWLEAPSGAALAALGRSEVHAAGAHLLDSESGAYNVPFVERAFAGRSMVVINVAEIEEGLALAPGNPRRIRRVRHLAGRGVRFLNRSADAGARRLLDRLLLSEGVGSSEIEGYDRLAGGHLEAGQAVAAGAADAAVITCSTALGLGLHFIPLAAERFDLVVPKEWLGDPRVSRLLETLDSAEFRLELARVGGYQTRRSGQIVAELAQ